MTNIIDSISKSKKYSGLSEFTIQRCVDVCRKKYGEKDLEEHTRNLLHQIWGAYYTNRPDFKKLLLKFENATPVELKTKINDVLRIHSSSNERLNFIQDFYTKIFEITGMPQSISDFACGFNPLSLLLFDEYKNINYRAYDIDKDEISFLNNIFQIFNLDNFKAFTKDIFELNTEYSDVIFLLKFLPVIDQQSSNQIQDILKCLNCKFIVVSFPLKSISGKEKGMANHYSEKFESMFAEWQFDKISFPNELVYILKK